MCFLGREHIHLSVGICVSHVGEHTSLGICVSLVGEHIIIIITENMCFPGRGTHITRDMCSLIGKHIQCITRDMWFTGRGTHITKDMCFIDLSRITLQ